MLASMVEKERNIKSSILQNNPKPSFLVSTILYISSIAIKCVLNTMYFVIVIWCNFIILHRIDLQNEILDI